MRVKGKHVYLSGPMTGRDNYNIDAFVSANIVLKSHGAKDVYNPALEWLESTGHVGDHKQYMLESVQELMRSKDVFEGRIAPYTRNLYYDVLVSLPDWESSEGARLERMVAEALGIKVCNLSEVEQ